MLATAAWVMSAGGLVVESQKAAGITWGAKRDLHACRRGVVALFKGHGQGLQAKSHRGG